MNSDRSPWFPKEWLERGAGAQKCRRTPPGVEVSGPVLDADTGEEVASDDIISTISISCAPTTSFPMAR